MIQIILNNNNQPIQITYSIHLGGETFHWDDERIDKINNEHPAIYVTLGGHGSWHQAGDNTWYQWVLGCRKCTDKTSNAGDVLYPSTITASKNYTLIDVSDSLSTNSENHWIYWQGYWGNQWKEVIPINMDDDSYLEIHYPGPPSPPYIDYIDDDGVPGRWYMPIYWASNPNPSTYIICASTNSKVIIDDKKGLIFEQCEASVLSGCGDCSRINVVYSEKDLAFDIYSLDGKPVDLKISRFKRTGEEYYEVEFNNLRIPRRGKASLVFSPEQNPRFKIGIDRNNDGKIDRYKLPDTLMTK